MIDLYYTYVTEELKGLEITNKDGIKQPTKLYIHSITTKNNYFKR